METGTQGAWFSQNGGGVEWRQQWAEERAVVEEGVTALPRPPPLARQAWGMELS